MSRTSSSFFSSFRDMVVWQQSFNLAKGVHDLTRSLPNDERFGLAAALSRAAVSIPAKIAEGQRLEKKEFVRRLEYAAGHAAECETYLLLIDEIYPDEHGKVSELRDTVRIVSRMLGSLIYAISHPVKRAAIEESARIAEETSKQSA